jgi:hypothetical protein
VMSTVIHAQNATKNMVVRRQREATFDGSSARRTYSIGSTGTLPTRTS